MTTLFARRECRCLTGTARLIAVTGAAALALFLARGLCAFLAVSQPVGGPFLVVEGWMPAYAYREAADRFRNGGYTAVIAAGVIQEEWGPDAEPREHFGSELLVKYGVPGDRVVKIPSDRSPRDRTFHSALAVTQWLRVQGVRGTSIDVVTVGPHARRSRLLYERAVAGDVAVGVVAVRDRRFDPDHWWRSSEGFRTVVDEAIAYAYARLPAWTAP